MVNGIRLLLALLFLALASFEVKAVDSSFEVINDKKLRTVRYIPEAATGEALILVHGFSRNAKRMAGHAESLASQGVTVWTPNLYSLMGGASSRAKNVEFLLGLVRQLSQSHERISLAGHSAGGALVFSTTVRAQQVGIPVAQLILLDAVPWSETIEVAPLMQPLPLLSLTAEPSAMNANLKVEKLHAAIGFPYIQLHLVDSSHVDPEDPPGAFSRSFTTGNGRELFAELLRRFVLQEGFEAYVTEQTKLGRIRQSKDTTFSPSTGSAHMNTRLDLNPDAWRAVNDGVMGGISTGRMVSSEDGLRFEGELSLEYNGGFASVRRLVDQDLSQATAVRLQLRGDGRTYQFRIRQDSRMDGVAWRAEFETHGEWQTVELSLDEFSPVFRGRLVGNAGPVVPARIIQVGFMLADKNAGAFELDVKSIEFVMTPN